MWVRKVCVLSFFSLIMLYCFLWFSFLVNRVKFVEVLLKMLCFRFMWVVCIKLLMLCKDSNVNFWEIVVIRWLCSIMFVWYFVFMEYFNIFLIGVIVFEEVFKFYMLNLNFVFEYLFVMMSFVVMKVLCYFNKIFVCVFFRWWLCVNSSSSSNNIIINSELIW